MRMENNNNNNTLPLLKAKCCPRAMPVQHFVNLGQLSCKKHAKTHVTLTFNLSYNLDIQ